MRKLVLLSLLAALPLFAAKPWETFDYAKERLTDAAVADRTLDELRLVRGIIFGRHGRVFGVDRDIDRYLRAQSWYKANPDFDNIDLSELEHASLDVIRGAEARLHAHVEPGDMRWWKARSLSESLLGEHTGPELRVLLAEIEAIHGKYLEDSPTLQAYFDARYWYRMDRDYDPKVLTAIERKNLDVIESAIHRQRKVVLLPGDLAGWLDKPITPLALENIGLHELRLLRNEIYARRGRPFKDQELREYFTSFDWYHPASSFNEASLTPVEHANAELIRRMESEASSRINFEG